MIDDLGYTKFTLSFTQFTFTFSRQLPPNSRRNSRRDTAVTGPLSAVNLRI